VKNYLKFEDVLPESIGIQPQFTLNEKSLLMKEFDKARYSS